MAQQIKYTRIEDGVGKQKPISTAVLGMTIGLGSLVLIATVTCLSFGLLGFAIGMRVPAQAEAGPVWLSPLGRQSTTFEYQKVFTLGDSNETREQWHALFPAGGGFVKHPTVSPDMASLAVYHQLHCLNHIRVSYWAAVDGTVVSDHQREGSHVRHCIDYLRQSLLCHADANFEMPSREAGGVTGFGFERQCRDIAQLKAWAEEWRMVEDFQGF